MMLKNFGNTDMGGYCIMCVFVLCCYKTFNQKVYNLSRQYMYGDKNGCKKLSKRN